MAGELREKRIGSILRMLGEYRGDNDGTTSDEAKNGGAEDVIEAK